MTDTAVRYRVVSFAGRDSGYNSSVPASHAEEANLYEEPPDSSAIYEEPPQVGAWRRIKEPGEGEKGHPGAGRDPRARERGFVSSFRTSLEPFYERLFSLGTNTCSGARSPAAWAKMSRKPRNPGVRPRLGRVRPARGCCCVPSRR